MLTVDLSGARNGEPLEQRIARLEDIEAIKKLKAVYAYYCDLNYDQDGIASLFTKDAVWEGDAFGTYEGVDAIRKFMGKVSRALVWAHHYMVNPIIDVAPDGQSATARWVLFGPATGARKGEPDVRDSVVQAGNYEDTMVKEDGQWKFKRVKIHTFFMCNLDEGWAKRPFRW